MERPSQVLGRRKKDGTRSPTVPYIIYLRDLIRVTPRERKEWKNLGVHLTGEEEERLVGADDLYADIEMVASM